MICAYIGLGANLNAPLQQLAAAVTALTEHPEHHSASCFWFLWLKTHGPARPTRLCECSGSFTY